MDMVAFSKTFRDKNGMPPTDWHRLQPPSVSA